MESETIGGVEFFSNYNAFCSIGQWVNENDGYEDILDSISKTEFINFRFKYTNKNAEAHKEYFENSDIKVQTSLDILENSRGYKTTILESWEEENDERHPSFIVYTTNGVKERTLMIVFNANEERYYSQSIQKICLEFWAQLEVEQGKSA